MAQTMKTRFFVLAAVGLVIGCASAPRVVPDAFRPGTKLSVATYQSEDIPQTSVDATMTYPTFRTALGDCTHLEVTEGAGGGGVTEPQLSVAVRFVPYFLTGGKLEGRDTAQVAVSAKASARDARGQLVWSDDVSVYSKRFSMIGAYEERARSAASGAVSEAASRLVDRLCLALRAR
jgi:hypothetical protein